MHMDLIINFPDIEENATRDIQINNLYAKVILDVIDKKYGYRKIQFKLYPDVNAQTSSVKDVLFTNSPLKPKDKTKYGKLEEKEVKNISNIDVELHRMPYAQEIRPEFNDFYISSFIITIPNPHYMDENIQNAIIQCASNPAYEIPLNNLFNVRYSDKDENETKLIYTTGSFDPKNKTVLGLKTNSDTCINDLFQVIENRFAGSSRYKISNGTNNNIIINDTQTGTDFEIKTLLYDTHHDRMITNHTRKRGTIMAKQEHKKPNPAENNDPNQEPMQQTESVQKDHQTDTDIKCQLCGKPHTNEIEMYETGIEASSKTTQYICANCVNHIQKFLSEVVNTPLKNPEYDDPKPEDAFVGMLLKDFLCTQTYITTTYEVIVYDHTGLEITEFSEYMQLPIECIRKDDKEEKIHIVLKKQ